MAECTIAIDAMGGDYAPLEILKGSIKAKAKFPSTRIILVGPEKKLIDTLENECDCASWKNLFDIVDAPEVIGMDESPVKALREKKKSSISVAVDLVKKQEADGIVSLGNTGVVVAAATLKLRSLPNVHRAGIAIPLPTFGGGPCVMLDMGANVACKAENLSQYATMGTIYSQQIFNVDNPRVGLLNIGEETEKGNDLVKESFSVLEDLPINFKGNAEGRDIYTGEFDVIVCDGFVGNVVLKTSEGLVAGIMKSLKEEMGKKIRTTIGGALAMPAFRALKTKVDYSEYGGAVLLGVNGIVIVGHGSSKDHAAFNAIGCAIDAVQNNVNDKIIEAIK